MNARRFDRLIERFGTVAAGLPDRRTGHNGLFGMADFVLSAFAVFFTQCPSFLSFQRNMEQARGRHNARSLFQVERIPTDNPIRQTLDPVAPSELFSLFDELHQAFAQVGLLEAMRAVGPTRLIALDATWYFSSPSKNIHGPNCSCLRHAEGQTTHFHSAITPVIVSPGHRQVVPLRPEFVTPQDGPLKQDCEMNAAQRWLAAHAARYSTGHDTLLGDDLYGHQPFCRQVPLHGYHFLLTCKPASPIYPSQWVEALEPGRALHTLNLRHHFLLTCKPASPIYPSQWVEALEPGRALHTLKLRLKGQSNRWEHHCYRWANGAPLTDSDDALKVNWCEGTITDSDGKALYRKSFITDWKLSADNVAGWVAAGRARWKIENENNNVLKTNGYHLEHNFGHGKKHLASLLMTMNGLAFGLHTPLELTDESYRLIRAKVGPRRPFFQRLQALTTYLDFDSWERLMDFMTRGLEIGPYAVPKSRLCICAHKTRRQRVGPPPVPI